MITAEVSILMLEFGSSGVSTFEFSCWNKVYGVDYRSVSWLGLKGSRIYFLTSLISIQDCCFIFVLSNI